MCFITSCTLLFLFKKNVNKKKVSKEERERKKKFLIYHHYHHSSLFFFCFQVFKKKFKLKVHLFYDYNVELDNE